MDKYLSDKNESNIYEAETPHFDPIDRCFHNARYKKISGEYLRINSQKSNEATLICVGDMLCEDKLFKSHKNGEGFFFYDVFSFVQSIIKNSDLAMGNLETTICSSAPYTGEQYKIDGKYHCNSPIEFLDAIKAAGFDLLVMSNNHNLDSGFSGVMETIHHVEQCNIMRTGLFKPDDDKRYIIANVNGIKVGVMAYSTWFNRNQSRFTELGRNKILNEYSPEKVLHDVKLVKSEGAEFVLVYIHWGTDAEYKFQPSDSMRRIAREIADCGADYIVGSHTHSLQPHELITASDGRFVPCCFSLGNFVTSDINRNSRETGLLKIELKRKNGRVHIADEQFVPCFVPDKKYYINYPIIPFLGGEDFGDLKREYSFALSHIKNVIGVISRTRNEHHEKCSDYLDTNYICDVLGVRNSIDHFENYTMINFAMDAKNNGVAVITEISSDPNYITPDKRCAELADIAISNGARLLIANRQYKDYPTLIYKNPFEAYCKIISSLRSNFKPCTVSITGSIGKTTETEMVYSVLSNKFSTHRNTGSANNVRYSGTVIQGLLQSHQFYVQELMEGPPFGAASTISKLVRPDMVIVTKIGSSHIEAFGSQERILKSCLGVQDGMSKDGTLILNADDYFQWNARELCSRKIIYYGIDNKEADYCAINIHHENEFLEFDIKNRDMITHVKLHCFGRHNILNSVAAFVVGKMAGMTDDEVVSGLQKYRTSGIRQNYVRFGGYGLYLDCYNASPESIAVALNAFKDIPVVSKGRRIGVLADVVEVGDKAEEYHRTIGRNVAESCIELLICYGSNAAYIAEEVKQCKNIPVYYANSIEELVLLIKKNIKINDITLFKGSHSMELEHVVDMIWGTWYHEEFERYDFKTHVAEDDNFKYRVYTDHVTIFNKKSNIADLVFPDYIEGLPITGIESNTFCKSKYTQSIKFPSKLSSIRYCAFYKANCITKIDVPQSVRIIDASAFSTCDNLESVRIADGCTHIGYRAFGNCKKLKDIFIPASVKQIGDEAFVNCETLTIHAPRGSYADKYAKNNGIKIAR
ncbi:CapA family protein [Butyrivibrio sp. AE2005]|uniref:CapA family protein n=1 Tax=Butyrivibrio sp. AE2005 TaxID=1496722 RepID=UPI00047961A0|nr:CapA family protein [Butyrivibrio sp. AE2005]